MKHILLSILLLAANGCTTPQHRTTTINDFVFPWSDKPPIIGNGDGH